MITEIFLVFIFSYLSGSIPFGLILTKLFLKKDIRKIGSKNIGTTNVLRTGNKFLAAATLVFDILKGYLPVVITVQYFSGLIELSCLATFLGHIFPIWLRFRGGKGVATYLGVLFALSLQLSLLFMFTWLAISLIFRYSSLSSMFASLTVFVVQSIREIVNPILLKMPEQTLFSNTVDVNTTFLLFTFFILIIFTHRKNISNLKNKSEQKIKL